MDSQVPKWNTVNTALVSRQPIFDRDRNLFAYELLYRNQFDTSDSLSGESSSAEVLRNTFMEIGLEQIVGTNPAFVNMTRNFILGGYCSLLPKERVVLEVLESVTPDAAVIEALSALAADGYKIALDDFAYSEEKRPLLELANYVKVDFRMFSPQQIEQQLREIKPFKTRLVAEKIETYGEFELARQLGFDYFQGFFLCQPRTLKASRIPLNRLSTLRLIARLRQDDLSADELENLIQQDPGVSSSLLRYVISAQLPLLQPVDSIAQAVQMVGRGQIKVWANLLLLSSFEDKPRELIVTALVRAKMAERLAAMTSTENADSYYTTGMFSVADALLDLSMPE